MYRLFLFCILILSPALEAAEREDNRPEWLKSPPLLADPLAAFKTEAVLDGSAALGAAERGDNRPEWLKSPPLLADPLAAFKTKAVLEGSARLPGRFEEDRGEGLPTLSPQEAALAGYLHNAATHLNGYTDLVGRLNMLPRSQRFAIICKIAIGLPAGSQAVCDYMKARGGEQSDPEARKRNFLSFRRISQNPAAPDYLKEKAEVAMLCIWRAEWDDNQVFSLWGLQHDEIMNIFKRVIDSQSVANTERIKNAFTYAQLLKYNVLSPARVSGLLNLYDLIISLNPSEGEFEQAVYDQAFAFMFYKPQNTTINVERLRGIQNSQYLTYIQKKRVGVWLASLNGESCKSCWLSCFYSVFCCYCCC